MIDPSTVRARLDAVIDAAKRSGAWDVARPDDGAFAHMGAFGMNTMAFEQWLRFVFVPNVEALISTGGPWPGSSSVATQAVREGDTNPAVAALVEPLAAFDALFEPASSAPPVEPASQHPREEDAAAPAPAVDENAAGWALATKPDHTPADLEAAIACFRRSIANDRAAASSQDPSAAAARSTPQAAANLGNALVELGREAEALDELARVAAGDDAIAGAAHNWLGWRLGATDAARALAHLRDATRLRPTWGVAWQNLARALDGAGDLAAACEAYGNAIAAGDAHDDAFARDRRLQLEMQLAARGAPIPPVPDAARPDSAAFAIVRELAARVASPLAFAIRPTTRQSPWAIVGAVSAGRALGHAIVGATRDGVTVTLHARSAGALVFEQHELAPPAAAERILAWLETVDAAALLPIDAAMFLRDQVMGAPWCWELASYQPAGVALVEPGTGVRVTATARREGGVEVGLLPEGPGQAPATLVAETPARLLELAPTIADATRRAMAARAAFVARPFGVRHAAALLAGLPALREPTFSERYPAWPEGWLQDAGDGVTLVWLVESADGVTITIGRTTWTVRSADELRPLVPAIADALAADRVLVRAARIQVRDRFRVIAPFAGFERGAEIEYATESFDPRGDYRAYELRDLHGPHRVWLDENSEPDRAILGELDRYVEPLMR